MTFKVDDRVLETTATTGTGAVNLAGAKTGRQTFVAGIGDGNSCPYLITDGTDWEVGIGTVSSGTPDQLSRDQVLSSSNGDAAVNWGSGSKDVACVAAASMFNGPAAASRSIGSAATLTIKDNGHALVCSADFTQALPALSAVFEGWGVWIIPGPGVTITIDPNGSDLILDAASLAVTAPTLVVAGPSQWEVPVGPMVGDDGGSPGVGRGGLVPAPDQGDAAKFLRGDGVWASAARIAVGQYTGDGTTSKSITGLGFAPKFVEISARETVDGTASKVWKTTSAIVDDNANGMAILISSAGITVQQSRIRSLDADGFTVGDEGIDGDPNSNGVIFNYLAIG